MVRTVAASGITVTPNLFAYSDYLHAIADLPGVLADPEMQKKFATLGLDVVGSTSEETRAAIAADIPKWAQVIKDANIKPGN